ncbi:MAG TPA: FtsL-like putative cell division protein [Bacteroidota bacterium]|nr:FtsL-like putative cell division protein [Bacteroidota bacterium]
MQPATPEAKDQIPEPATPPRPLVYSGTMPTSTPNLEGQGFVTPPRNRKIAKRKVSTFNIILMLFGAATVIVLYISNIIAVDRLMMEINSLQQQHSRILSEQELLKAEVNRLSSLERINRKATEELGLVNPKEPPIWMNVDREKIREIEEALQQKHQP